METKTLTLADFLLARISEDEATFALSDSDSSTEYLLCERILAECEAKRRIVEAHEGSESLTSMWYLGVIAAPYADHPDYREEWKP